MTVTCDNTLFVAGLTRLVSSRLRESSETFLLSSANSLGIVPKVPFAYKKNDSNLALYRIRIPDRTNSQVKIGNN